MPTSVMDNGMFEKNQKTRGTSWNTYAVYQKEFNTFTQAPCEPVLCLYTFVIFCSDPYMGPKCSMLQSLEGLNRCGITC